MGWSYSRDGVFQFQNRLLEPEENEREEIRPDGRLRLLQLFPDRCGEIIIKN